MTTLERPPLGVLSTNSLNRAHSDLVKPHPRLKASVSKPSFLSRAGSSITKTNSYANHARKLKYRLKLAYYKLQTDQVGMPLTEIIKKHDVLTTSASSPTSFPTISTAPAASIKKKLLSTPSLTRHISLLAASTPLQSSSFLPILPKKSVTFKRSNSYVDPPTKEGDQSKKKKKNVTLPRINEYPTFTVDSKALRTISSPQLGRPMPHPRSLRIEDLVDTRATPVKPYRSEAGDLLLSSPTKKACSSTPGSYGAAKSLLQLSTLIGSN